MMASVRIASRGGLLIVAGLLAGGCGGNGAQQVAGAGLAPPAVTHSAPEASAPQSGPRSQASRHLALIAVERVTGRKPSPEDLARRE